MSEPSRLGDRDREVLDAVAEHGYLGSGLPISVVGVGCCGVCYGHSPSWEGHEAGIKWGEHYNAALAAAQARSEAAEQRNRWLEQRFIDQAHTLHAETRNRLLDRLEAVREVLDAAEECGDGVTAELVHDLRAALAGDAARPQPKGGDEESDAARPLPEPEQPDAVRCTTCGEDWITAPGCIRSADGKRSGHTVGGGVEAGRDA